jgi:flavin reductase (DIM6/NTAB) family NADH-FMN oxidoreductase RutF
MGGTADSNSPPTGTPSVPDEGESVARAMEAFTSLADYPLMVVTVGTADGARSGCVAGFVTQCSIRPPRFLVCISKLNHTFFLAERSDSMALHLLGAGQTELGRLFAEKTGDTYDKFAHCSWHPGTTGAPVLDECAAWVEGVSLGHSGVGDHEAFLFRPMAGGRGSVPADDGLLTLASAPDFQPGHPEA